QEREYTSDYNRAQIFGHDVWIGTILSPRGRDFRNCGGASRDIKFSEIPGKMYVHVGMTQPDERFGQFGRDTKHRRKCLLRKHLAKCFMMLPVDAPAACPG